MKNLIRKGIFAVVLLLSSVVSYADAGLFLDGTVKYAKTGIIQSSFPDIPLYKCPKIQSCQNLFETNAYVGVVFRDYKKMDSFIKLHKNDIDGILPIYKIRHGKTVFKVWDLSLVNGTGVVLIQIIEGKNKDTNSLIATAITYEFTSAYIRAGYY